jgi:hypothetical protein
MQATQNKESLLISLVTRMVNKSIMKTSQSEYPVEEETALNSELCSYIQAGGKEEDVFDLEIIKEAAEKVARSEPSV